MTAAAWCARPDRRKAATMVSDRSAWCDTDLGEIRYSLYPEHVDGDSPDHARPSGGGRPAPLRAPAAGSPTRRRPRNRK
jgi:hypothetical protein